MDSNSRQYSDNGHSSGNGNGRTFHSNERRLTDWIAPFRRFDHGNIVVDVNKLPLRFPQFSIRIGTLHPDGHTSGFVVYRTDQHAGGNPNADMVLDLMAQALDFIKDEIAKHGGEMTSVTFDGPPKPAPVPVAVEPDPEEKPKRQRRRRKGGVKE
jgi:hypothetical protein